MPPGGPTAKRRRNVSGEREKTAVQAEIALPLGCLEALLTCLGIRPGIFASDDAYHAACRNTVADEERSSMGADVGNGSTTSFLAFDSHGSWRVMTGATGPSWPSGPRQGTPGHAGAASAGGDGGRGSASIDASREQKLPAFGLSWQYPETVYRSAPAHTSSSPSDAAAAAARGSGPRAAGEGGEPVRNEVPQTGVEGGAPTAAAAKRPPTTEAARPPVPAPTVRHLGFGIVVDVKPPHSAAAQPQSAGVAAGDSGGGPDATVHDGTAAAADQATATTNAAAGGRAGQQPLATHPRVRAVRRCADLFRSRHTAFAEKGARHGALLPAWYTRPSSGSPAAERPTAHPPPAPAAGQLRLGKRIREDGPDYIDGTTGFRPPPPPERSGPAQGALLAPGAQRESPAGDPGSGSSTRDPGSIPQPKEPPADSAPYGELLFSVQRMGYDLCCRARDQSAGSTGVWRLAWARVLLMVMDKLRRLLHARSAVSKYVPGAHQGRDGCAVTRRCEAQPLASHSQLRAAVQLLLLVATELPPGRGPRAGVAPEAWDALEYLLGSSPFADFEGCDPQARAILADAALHLAGLAAERGRGDSAWREVLGRVLPTRTGWLARQCDTVRQLRAPLLEGTMPERQQGGLCWDALAAGVLPDEERQRQLAEVYGGHKEVLVRMVTSLTVLLQRAGAPLALRLLDRDLLDTLLPPSTITAITGTGTPLLPASLDPFPGGLAREPHRSEVLVMLHAALWALAPAADTATTAGVPGSAAGPGALGRLGGLVTGSPNLRVLAEGVLRSECRAPDQLLVAEVETEFGAADGPHAMSGRDAVVPLLGTLYSVMLCEGALPGWAALEGAVHGAASETTAMPAHSALRKAWECGCDRRFRSLTLSLLAQAVRALGRLGQQAVLAAALRSNTPGSRPLGGEQLGLLGVWLRAALDPGSRPMLAALTRELILSCSEARALLVWPGGDGNTGPGPGDAPAGATGAAGAAATASVSSGAAAESLSTQIAVALVTDASGTVCAQLAAALMAGLVRARRLGDVRGVLWGLDLCWRALRRELPRGGGPTWAGAAAGAAVAAAAAAIPSGAPSGDAGTGSGSGSGPPLATMRAHRVMACVALAALEPCAGGSLARHAAVAASSGGGGSSGGGAGPRLRPTWLEQQGGVRVLECVVEAIADDAAALVRWRGAVTGPGAAELVSAWSRCLLYDSSVGVLSDFAVVLSRSVDCRTDYAADPVHTAEHSVLQRCLALLCLLVSELPSHAEAHTATSDHLRRHVTHALLDHLHLPAAANATGSHHLPADPPLHHRHQQQGHQHQQRPWGLNSEGDVHHARNNLARMLHRCVATSLRHYVLEGLKVRVPQSAQARHAANALVWLRCVLGHPVLREKPMLERLLPPMLNLVVECLEAARGLLLSKGLLRYDAENPGQELPAPAPSQQQPHPPPLMLLRELWDTATAVLAAAAGAGLVASREEAYGTAPGSVRIDASPLLLMEPAPRSQLRAATGFAVSLLLRTCLECFVLPLDASSQQTALAAARPQDEERTLRVRLRLASCLGYPPALGEAERPGCARRACGPDVMKLSAAPAAVDGADGSVKLSVAAIGCANRLVQALDAGGYTWAPPVVEAVRLVARDMGGQRGVSLTNAQKGAMVALLRGHQSRVGARPGPGGGRPQPQPSPQPSPPPQQQQPQQQLPAPVGAGHNQQQQQQLPAPVGAGHHQQQQQQPQQQLPAPVGAGHHQQQQQDRGPHRPPHQPQQQRHQPGRDQDQAGGGRRDVGPQPGPQRNPVGTAGPPAPVPADRGSGEVTQPRTGDDRRTAEDVTHARGHGQHPPAPGRAPAHDAPHRHPREDTGQSRGSQAAASTISPAGRSGGGGQPGGGRTRVYANPAGLREGGEDCRTLLAGSVPFAELPALLLQRQQQQQEHVSPAVSQVSQAGGRAAGSGKVHIDLPPLVGEVVDPQPVAMKTGHTVLQMALRDASVEKSKPVTLYVSGSEDTLRSILLDLSNRKTIIGVFGAVLLELSARNARANQGSGPAAVSRSVLARLILDTSASGGSSSSRPSGLVVEPRIGYVEQLRSELAALSQRAAAATVVAGTSPAEPRVAQASAGSERRLGGPSQQAEASGGVAAVLTQAAPARRAPLQMAVARTEAVAGGAQPREQAAPLATQLTRAIQLEADEGALLPGLCVAETQQSLDQRHRGAQLLSTAPGAAAVRNGAGGADGPVPVSAHAPFIWNGLFGTPREPTSAQLGIGSGTGAPGPAFHRGGGPGEQAAGDFEMGTFHVPATQLSDDEAGV